MSLPYSLNQKEDGTGTVSALIEGQWYTADHKHAHFHEIINALVTDSLTPEEIRDLFDLSFAVGARLQRLSARTAIVGGTLLFDGDRVHGSIVDYVLRLHKEGSDDVKPLVNFMDKVNENPSQRSKDCLFEWCKDNDITIAPDGDLIAYKSVQDDVNFLSVNSGAAFVDGEWVKGQIPNKPGSIIEMPRESVDDDPNSACSVGLHAATFPFAQGFTRGPIMKLKIHPRDVVSVPTDSGAQKMRVCRYLVLEQVQRPVEETVDHSPYLSDDDWDEDLYDEEQEAEELLEDALEDAASRLGDEKLLKRLKKYLKRAKKNKDS